MPKIDEKRGLFRRPRKWTAKQQREKEQAQAYRILAQLCTASSEWAFKHIAGTYEREISLENALHLSLVVKRALELAEANPDGSEGKQQKILFDEQVARRKEHG